MKDFWNHIKADARNQSKSAEVISWTCAEFCTILSEKRFFSSSWMWSRILADIAYSILMEFAHADCDDIVESCYTCLVRVLGW